TTRTSSPRAASRIARVAAGRRSPTEPPRRERPLLQVTLLGRLEGLRCHPALEVASKLRNCISPLSPLRGDLWLAEGHRRQGRRSGHQRALRALGAPPSSPSWPLPP